MKPGPDQKAFANELAKASSNVSSLQEFFEKQLDAPGGVRVYETSVSNPSQQLKNKLAQAAPCKGVLVLTLADRDALERAHDSLRDNWASNAEWSKALECVVLGTKAGGSFSPSALVRWRRGAWADRMAQLFPSMAVESAQGSPADSTFDIGRATSDLFMSADDFSEMVEQLRRKKNLILQGPPGVGKTFVAKTLAFALMGERDDTRLRQVQFHQSYAYEDFVQGWRPPDGGGFRRRDGVFFEFCERAREHGPDVPHVFVIDEVNRGNLSKIFGELLMLIERDKRGESFAIPLTYSDPAKKPVETFSVPENVHILGLMNTADRSLAMVDYALRRRFAFKTLRPRLHDPKFRMFLEQANVAEPTIDRIVDRVQALNQRICDDTRHLGPGFEIGHSYFCDPQGDSDAWYRAVVLHEIEPLLREYWFDDPKRADEEVRNLLS